MRSSYPLMILLVFLLVTPSLCLSLAASCINNIFRFLSHHFMGLSISFPSLPLHFYLIFYILSYPLSFVLSAHKANHHFDPNRVNCGFDLFWHPRFGKLKAMRALRDIAPGEELFVDYGYPRRTQCGPQWFKDGLKSWRSYIEKHNQENPQFWRETGALSGPGASVKDLRNVTLDVLPITVLVQLNLLFTK